MTWCLGPIPLHPIGQPWPEDDAYYQPRILEIPALGITALWLHASDQDYFIPYLGAEGEMKAPIVEQDFLKNLRERAVQRLQKNTGPSGYPSARKLRVTN